MDIKGDYCFCGLGVVGNRGKEFICNRFWGLGQQGKGDTCMCLWGRGVVSSCVQTLQSSRDDRQSTQVFAPAPILASCTSCSYAPRNRFSYADSWFCNTVGDATRVARCNTSGCNTSGYTAQVLRSYVSKKTGFALQLAGFATQQVVQHVWEITSLKPSKVEQED